jgi:pilus assembly protein CpaC
MIRNSYLLSTSPQAAARGWARCLKSWARFLKKSTPYGAVLAALGVGALLGQTAEDLRITVGKSAIIDYPSDVRQIETSNPEVLDASPITTREILLNGKGVGNSTMIVWSKTGQRTFYDVNVELNLEPLRRILRESFPDETIEPHSSRDSITLTGTVSSKDVADRACALAGAMAKAAVCNLLVRDGPPEKQILLRVRFAQLDREKERQYGVNLLAAPGNNPIGANTGQFAPSTPTAILNVPQNAGGGSTAVNSATYSISQVLNIFALDPKLNLGVFIKALQQETILQILAEPNLVTSNGKEASFLVGGEFPVPVLQGGANSGAVTVQFRQYGIRLTFTPVVTPHNTIKMYLKQEVSSLDLANSVVLNGFTIPALSSRTAETNVELGDGQSFVVAGLVNNQESNALSKVPVLGNLPILGALFKSKDEKLQRTELIMVVTPEVTMPLGPNDPKPDIYMPKDFLVRLEPKDIPKDDLQKASKTPGRKK